MRKRKRLCLQCPLRRSRSQIPPHPSPFVFFLLETSSSEEPKVHDAGACSERRARHVEEDELRPCAAATACHSTVGIYQAVNFL